MTRPVLADSGPLYAAADEGDAHHEQALRQLQKLANDRREVVIAYPTLLETYGLVLFRMGTAAALKWLSFMSDVALVNPTHEDYRQAFTRVRALPDQRDWRRPWDCRRPLHHRRSRVRRNPGRPHRRARQSPGRRCAQESGKARRRLPAGAPASTAPVFPKEPATLARSAGNPVRLGHRPRALRVRPFGCRDRSALRAGRPG